MRPDVTGVMKKWRMNLNGLKLLDYSTKVAKYLKFCEKNAIEILFIF